MYPFLFFWATMRSNIESTLAAVGVPAIAVRLSTIGYSPSGAVMFVALKQRKKHKPQRGDNVNKNITAPLGLAL